MHIIYIIVYQNENFLTKYFNSVTKNQIKVLENFYFNNLFSTKIKNILIIFS